MRDTLFQLDPDTRILPAMLAECLDRSHHEVVGSAGQRGVVTAEIDLALFIGQLDTEVVVEINRHHQRLQRVKTIIALAQNPEGKIDFGGSDELHSHDIVTNQMAAKDKLIIALDFPRAEDALELADKTRHLAGFFKVGLELFTACGPSVVRDLKAGGAKIFLDLKCHDIPNTVAGAVRSAADLGVDMLTIHLGGGPEMVERAAEAAEGTGMTILGVTVLTSSDAETLRATGVQAAAVEDQVLRLARLGLEAGAGGIVASPKEITLLRQIFGDTFTLVTPGVRPAWAATDDQKRVLTPKEAVDSGANHLVIGRPVTAADDPVNALEKIIGEISA